MTCDIFLLCCVCVHNMFRICSRGDIYPENTEHGCFIKNIWRHADSHKLTLCYYFTTLAKQFPNKPWCFINQFRTRIKGDVHVFKAAAAWWRTPPPCVRSGKAAEWDLCVLSPHLRPRRHPSWRSPRILSTLRRPTRLILSTPSPTRGAGRRSRLRHGDRRRATTTTTAPRHAAVLLHAPFVFVFKFIFFKNEVDLIEGATFPFMTQTHKETTIGYETVCSSPDARWRSPCGIFFPRIFFCIP